MDQERDIEQLIDDYIFNRLNAQAAAQFEERMKTNTDIAKQVQLRLEMKSGIEAFGRKDLKNLLQDIHQEVVPTQTIAKRRSLMPYLAVVAVALVLITALAWLFGGNKQAQTPGALYAAYFKPYQLSENQRSTTDPALFEIEGLYNTGKYEQALPLIKAHLDTASQQASSWLLAAGISALETGDTQQALGFFEKIKQNQDFNFVDEVNWYTALTHLKAGDIAASKTALQVILADKSADHYKEAQELLEKI